MATMGVKGSMEVLGRVRMSGQWWAMAL